MTPAAVRLPFHPVAALSYAVLTVLAVLSTPSPAFTDASAAREALDPTELSLQQLLDVEVYSASKFAQKTSDAPSDVSVVTAEDIRTYGYRRLTEILAAMPGLYAYTDRNYDFVGVRGLAPPGDYLSRVLLLVDGIRMNDGVYGAAAIGTEFPVDVDLIDRVEFVPGPGSSIYGSNAVLGVINVITRRGRDMPGLEGSVELGDGDTRKGRITYAGRSDGGLEWLASASAYRSGGKDLYLAAYDAPSTHDGIAHGVDYDRNDQGFAKLSIGGLTVEAAYGNRKKGVPTGAYGCIFDNPDCHTVDTQAFLDVRYDRPLGGGRELSMHAAHDFSPYDGTYPHDGGSGGPIANIDLSRPEWSSAEARVVDRSLADHTLVYGLETHRESRNVYRNYDLSPYASYVNADTRSNYDAMYLQDEWSLSRRLIVNAGARYDRYSTFGGITDPRLGIIYRPDRATNLKLLYGRAFRAPNAYELNNGGIYQAQGNRDLRPERVDFYEAVLERNFGRDTRLSASAYRFRIEDMINQVFDPSANAVVFENVSGVYAHGIQFGAERRWEPGYLLRASATFQRSEDTASRTELTNSPRSLAKLHLSTPPALWGCRAGLETQYVSARTTQAGRTGGYAVTNATVTRSALKRRLELSASAYNLFDKRYYAPATANLSALGLDAIPQDVRSLRLKLTYRF
jgi:outer membrane receptor protein involved in Fe transport